MAFRYLFDKQHSSSNNCNLACTFLTWMLDTVSSKKLFGVECSILGKAPCINVFEPIIRCEREFNASRTCERKMNFLRIVLQQIVGQYLLAKTLFFVIDYDPSKSPAWNQKPI